MELGICRYNGGQTSGPQLTLVHCKLRQCAVMKLEKNTREEDNLMITTLDLQVCV